MSSIDQYLDEAYDDIEDVIKELDEKLNLWRATLIPIDAIRDLEVARGYMLQAQTHIARKAYRREAEKRRQANAGSKS